MKQVMLGDLVTITGGGTPDRGNPTYWGGDIPWVTVKDFKSFDISGAQEHITEAGLARSASNLIPHGAIIIPTRMALGKAAINKVDIAINQDIKALQVRDSAIVDRDYLFRFLLSKADYFESCGKGATVKGITLDILRNLHVPLPKIGEQKRIAAILAKTESLRRKRQEAILLADELLRSAFLEMFGNPEANPHGYRRGTIRELVATANYGTSEKASEDSGEFPILRMNNITYEGTWNFNSLKYVDLAPKIRDKFMTRKGDLLFNRTNSLDLVGKTAVFEGETPMAIAGYLVRVRTNDAGDPYYLSGYLNSTHGKATLKSMAKSIVGMANINAQEMQEIPILIPPIELQRRYGHLVRAVRASQKTQEKSLTDIVALGASLAAQSFAAH